MLAAAAIPQRRRFARGLALYALGACSVLLGRSWWLSERVTPATIVGLTRAQLLFIGSGLEARAAAMQRLFPEGRVFTLALYGGAWANLGHQAMAVTERAAARRECRRSLALLEAPASRAPFSPVQGLPHGMFYEAWTNWLRAGCLSLEDDSVHAAAAEPEFAASCARLELALREHGPFVQSYPGAAWPADSVVGVASLRGCGTWLDQRFLRAQQAWVTAAREKLDPATGLLPHAAKGEDARGSSAALSSAFLVDIDAEFAGEQYTRFRRYFSGHLLWALPAVLEYERGRRGPSDVDSGPLIFGVSAPATVVGIAAAIANGDRETALALRGASEAVGVPFEWAGARSYGFGLLPVGEAFLAWASSSEPWFASTSAPRATSISDVHSGWRARWRLTCLTCASILVALAFLVLRPRPN
jgi:hypothetical protein